MVPNLRPHARFAGPRTSGRIRRLLGATVFCVAGVAMAVNVAQADNVPAKERRFMIKAAEAGNAEINAGKIALEKSTNPAVRKFAETMIEDHTQIGAELKQLASTKEVSLPSDPALGQRARNTLLDKLDGHNFDRHYVESSGVKAHQDSIKQFETMAASAEDPDVRTFANRTLPGLREHLQMAEDLKHKVDAEGGVATRNRKSSGLTNAAP